MKSMTKAWLAAVCRDARIPPNTFRAAYAPADMASDAGDVIVDPAAIAVRTPLDPGDWHGIAARLRAWGYLQCAADATPPFQATLTMPERLPAKPAARAYRARRRSTARIDVLQAIAKAGGDGRLTPFVSWRRVISTYHAMLPALPTGQDADTVRKKLSRDRDRHVMAGEIELSAGGVRLTSNGFSRIATQARRTR